MANATIRIITDTEAVILSKGADEALTGRLAYASDKKKLYVGNGTKFVVATDTDVAVDEAKDYTDTAIYEFGDQVYSKEVIDNKLEPITDDISEIQDDLTNIHDDINNLYTNDQIDSMLDEKADKTDVYTKTEVDDKDALKADKSTTYTKAEVDAKQIFTEPGGIDLTTIEKLDEFYGSLPNNSRWYGYASPVGQPNPGWCEIHKYGNAFGKIVLYTRRPNITLIRTKDNNPTGWSNWFQLNMTEIT